MRGSRGIELDAAFVKRHGCAGVIVEGIFVVACVVLAIGLPMPMSHGCLDMSWILFERKGLKRGKKDSVPNQCRALFFVCTTEYHRRPVELTTKASTMNAGGMRPGIILLREGTDTSQVRRCSFFAIASFIDFLI